MRFSTFLIRSVLCSTLFVFAAALPAHAAESRFTVLFDTDNNTSTGCAVATGAGTMNGVEQMVTTVVRVSPLWRTLGLA